MSYMFIGQELLMELLEVESLTESHNSVHPSLRLNQTTLPLSMIREITLLVQIRKG